MGGKKNAKKESQESSDIKSEILNINRFILRNNQMLYDVNLKTNGEETFAVLPSGEMQHRDIDKLIEYLEDEAVKIYKEKNGINA